MLDSKIQESCLESNNLCLKSSNPCLKSTNPGLILIKKSQIPSKTQHYERRQLVLWNGEGFLGNTEHLVRIWGDTHTHKTLYRIDNLFKGFTTKVWEVFASFFSLLDKKTEKFYTTITVREKKGRKKNYCQAHHQSFSLYVEHVAYLKRNKNYLVTWHKFFHS